MHKLFTSEMRLPSRTHHWSSATRLGTHKAGVWLCWLSAALVAWAVGAIGISAAFAQAATNYTTVEAVAGKQVQLTYHATAKECMPMAPPTVKVTEPPKQGVLQIREGTLATDRFSGCGRIKAPVRVVFYQAREGYAGTDHVAYEVTDPKGEVSRYDVTITVRAGSPAAPIPKPKATPI